MAISACKLDGFIDQVTGVKKIYFDELDHLVENSRWLTTLVLAEIGGIAAYRKLLDAKSLSILFALIILILAMTIVCFMVCVLLSRGAKKEISTLVKNNIEFVKDIEGNGDITPNEGDKQVTQISIVACKHIATPCKL